MLGLRTAKRVAGSPMPLEGNVLAVITVTVQPAPLKEEPRLQHALESRTPEKGGVPGTAQVVPDALDRKRLP